MNEIKIEKGIPIPARGRPGAENGLTNLLRKAEVGDSFLYRNNSFGNIPKMLGVKIASRKQPDGQYRIWRTA